MLAREEKFKVTVGAGGNIGTQGKKNCLNHFCSCWKLCMHVQEEHFSDNPRWAPSATWALAAKKNVESRRADSSSHERNL